MEGGWYSKRKREQEGEREQEERGTRCPKGVFRNRGKMEENRYSLVAGKSRAERAERGCAETSAA